MRTCDRCKDIKKYGYSFKLEKEGESYIKWQLDLCDDCWNILNKMLLDFEKSGQSPAQVAAFAKAIAKFGY